MKRILMVGISLFVIAIVVLAQSKEQLLLSGWKFQRGAIPGAGIYRPVRLYTLVTELIQDNEVCDRMETKVGIRSIEYDEEGFKLNGKTRKLQDLVHRLAGLPQL